jgi:hypothetical protein
MERVTRCFVSGFFSINEFLPSPVSIPLGSFQIFPLFFTLYHTIFIYVSVSDLNEPCHEGFASVFL